MRITRLLPLALFAASLIPMSAHAETYTNGEVNVTVGDDTIVIGNGLVTRTFSRAGLETRSIQAFGQTRSGQSPDVVFGAIRSPVGASAPVPVDYEVTALPGGLALTRHLGLRDGARISSRIEVYEGIAGMRTQHTLDLTAPLVVERYEMDHLLAGAGARATAHAFRAGADWRYNSGWNPPGIGDKHTGQWRSTVEGGVGADLRAFGEWLEVSYPDSSTAAIVMERHDYASSRLEFDGATGAARAVVDLSRDLIYAGPLEEQIHVESPEPAEAGRVRVLTPGRPFALEPSWLVFGRDTDDTAAQFNALLAIRNRDFDRRVLFNTNNTFGSAPISTGAKDGANFETFQQLLPAIREAGITTFVFDDGWQAISGDWCPDSDACPEPRRSRDPVKFRARFPDPTFSAVREQLAGDPDTTEDDIALGLWMTPMEFHPSSNAFRTNPQWACLPVGPATAAVSIATPDSSSFEAGIGVWNPLAWGVNPEDPTEPMRLIDWIESRIERAITVYGATYFKFDYLAWIDCGGAEPVDQYQYREAFVSMLDRLISRHPEVLFTIDETNDYRMFPYESTARGATWFQNGSPSLAQTLHNIWNLSPFVPGYTIGQGIASNGTDVNNIGIDTLMAAGLTSHLTIWRDLRSYTPAQRAQIKVWTDFYRDNADSLATMTYPLLADPLGKTWTALQPWDAATASGWVLAYRQGDARSSVSVPLRGLGLVSDGTEFDVVRTDPVTGSFTAITLTAAELRAGALLASAPVNGYALFRVTPAAT